MREYKRLAFKQAGYDEEAGILSGYASVYGVLDDGRDIVEKGAFTKFLDERGFDRVKLLVLHNDYNLPIGKPIKLEETDKGLYIEARISDTTLGRDVKTLIRDGVIQELSIGYDAVTFDIDGQGVRHLRELNLLEVSVVTWAMNPEAVITGYKAARVPAAPTTSPGRKTGGHESAIARVKAMMRLSSKSRDRPRPQDARTIYDIHL